MKPTLRDWWGTRIVLQRYPTSRKVVPSKLQRELARGEMARKIIAAHSVPTHMMAEDVEGLPSFHGYESIETGRLVTSKPKPGGVVHRSSTVSQEGGLCSWCLANPGGCDV